jgi:predicted nucleic acid-binding protein
MGCRLGETEVVQAWLESSPRLPLDNAIAREGVLLRQQHGLKVQDVIIPTTARSTQLSLASRNSRDFPPHYQQSCPPCPTDPPGGQP